MITLLEFNVIKWALGISDSYAQPRLCLNKGL